MRQKLLISASALLLASAAGQAEALDLGVNSNTRAKTSVSTPAARANVDLGADVGLEGRSRARFERGYEDDDYDNVLLLRKNAPVQNVAVLHRLRKSKDSAPMNLPEAIVRKAVPIPTPISVPVSGRIPASVWMARRDLTADIQELC